MLRLALSGCYNADHFEALKATVLEAPSDRCLHPRFLHCNRKQKSLSRMNGIGKYA